MKIDTGSSPGAYPTNRCRHSVLWMFLAAVLSLSIADSARAVQYEFDPQGRLVSVVRDDGGVLMYYYDSAGNRVQFIQSDGMTGVRPIDIPSADFDADNSVDLADLAVLRAAFGAGPDDPCRRDDCDLDADGDVDLADVEIWYSVYPAGAKIPADRTGGGWTNCAEHFRAAPDDRVDFLDLAALAHVWGIGSSAADLDLLEAAWMSGAGPVAADCPAAAGESVSAGSESQRGRVSLRRPLVAADGPGYSRCEIVLSDVGEPVKCFQFRLGSDALPDLQSGADVTAGKSCVQLGSPAVSKSGASFFDVRSAPGGWLVTGACLDSPCADESGDLILATLTIPRTQGDFSFNVADGRFTTVAGELRSAAEWSETLALNPLPMAVALERIYPNPFNPSTMIRFVVPRTGRVRISVYDLQGRLVRSLLDELLDAGRYDRIWRGDDDGGRPAGSGAYFVRLLADGVVRSRKVLLVR